MSDVDELRRRVDVLEAALARFVGNVEIPNQALDTASSPTFAGLTDTGGLNIGTGSGALAGQIAMNSIIAAYGGSNTVAQGVPAMLAQVNLTGQGAAIGNTVLYAVPATGVGLYRVSWYAKVTTVDAVSSTLGAVQVLFTDATDSVALTDNMLGQTAAGAAAITATTNNTATVLWGTSVIWAKASTNISYNSGYVSNTPGQMKYELHIKLEWLG